MALVPNPLRCCSVGRHEQMYCEFCIEVPLLGVELQDSQPAFRSTDRWAAMRLDWRMVPLHERQELHKIWLLWLVLPFQMCKR